MGQEHVVEIIGVFIPIIAIISIVITIVYLRRFQNQERMAMIDKGLSPIDMKKPAEEGFGTLKAALLLIGAGFGFVLGYVLEQYAGMRHIIAYTSMLLLFGGVGLVAAYILQQKRLNKKEI
jgi:uncharacterized membrane protein YfcA